MMSIEKQVWFFGCGQVAKKFYDCYKDQLEIMGAISNNPKEHQFCTDDGSVYQVKRPETKTRQKGYVIICSNDYENIAEQLMLLGYTPFVDFMDFELAGILLEQRKLVLLYGICHVRGTKDYLNVSDSFREQYSAVYFPNYLSQSLYQQARLNYLVDHCQVFIYGIAVSPAYHVKNQAILDRLKPEVKRICMHTVYFGAYFPQQNRMYNDMNPYAVKCEGYDYTPFSYGDSWLNACIDQGMSVDDVIGELEQGSVYEEEFVSRYLQNEWKRLEFQEQNSDIKIVDYIKNNYRDRRLFRNEAHMENCVLQQYALQVLEYLGCTKQLPVIEEPLMRCSQHCIYPGVARQLQLKWDVWKETLDIYTYQGWKCVTLKEYIEDYMEVCGAMKHLKQKHFLP